MYYYLNEEHIRKELADKIVDNIFYYVRNGPGFEFDTLYSVTLFKSFAYVAVDGIQAIPRKCVITETEYNKNKHNKEFINKMDKLLKD